MEYIEKEDFLRRLKALRECAELVELVFPGRFTIMEKVTLAARVEFYARMEGAGAYPTGEPGIDVAGKLRRIAEVEDRA